MREGLVNWMNTKDSKIVDNKYYPNNCTDIKYGYIFDTRQFGHIPVMFSTGGLKSMFKLCTTYTCFENIVYIR